MSNPYTYNDPYAHGGGQQDGYGAGGQEYLAPQGQGHGQGHYDDGNSYNQTHGQDQYGNYNSYSNSPPEKDGADADGDPQLGQIGGGARPVPGRSGLQQPTSSFAAMGPPPRSTGVLRMWRKDERGKQWTRGGGVRSTGRMIFCCLTITIMLIVSIILAIVMFIRPPSLAMTSYQTDIPNINEAGGNFQFDVNLNITVTNPNWFNVNFKRVYADLTYPDVNNIQFGDGRVNSVNFKGYTSSQFIFPFTVNYTILNDPGMAAIKDLLNKCGNKSDIKVGYALHLWLRILGVTIKPTIKADMNVGCPLDIGALQGIIDSH